MNTNNTLQMDVLDILFANRNKMYGAYQLRRNYNKRLLVAVAVMLSVCLCFAIAYGIGKKERVSAPVLSVTDVNLISAPPKDKPAVQPPPVKQVKIEEPIATIKVTPPKIVPDELVTTPPPTQDDINDMKIDVKTTEGSNRGDYVVAPVEQGTSVAQAPVKIEDYNKEFFTVEQKAEFPGGLGEWEKFLRRNLRSELPSENGAAPGSYTVIVSFLVDKDGSVSEVKAENDPGYGTAAEAIRVFQRSQTWIPAKQNNHPVTYRQKQAITFVVNQE